jgi:hypothetical protein
MPNVIILRGDPEHQYKEAQADAAITPGDLLKFSANEKLVRHDAAGQNTGAVFALEMELVGSGIADSYASGATVRYCVARAGDEVYALLASGQNVTKDAFLESAGNGALRAYTNQSGQNVYAAAVVGVANEDKDNSSGDATGPHNNATRIRVEVL